MGKIYKGTSTSYSSQVGTINGDKIYQGTSTSYSNQVATVEGGHATAVAAAAYFFLL